MLRSLLIATLFVLLGACSPKIGRKCSSSIDCDVNGTRICDLSQPGGYCTVRYCEADTCPDGESVCVEFSPDEALLAVTYCVATCNNGGAFRDKYSCVLSCEIGEGVLGGEDNKSCAVTQSTQ